MITSVIIYHYGSALSLEIFRRLTFFFSSSKPSSFTMYQHATWCDEWCRPSAPPFFRFSRQSTSLVSDSTSTTSATGDGCWVVGVRKKLVVIGDLVWFCVLASQWQTLRCFGWNSKGSVLYPLFGHSFGPFSPPCGLVMVGHSNPSSPPFVWRWLWYCVGP